MCDLTASNSMLPVCCMQNASARDLASTLWGLAAAGVHPEKRWMNVFGAQVSHKLRLRAWQLILYQSITSVEGICS